MWEKRSTGFDGSVPGRANAKGLLTGAKPCNADIPSSDTVG